MVGGEAGGRNCWARDPQKSLGFFPPWASPSGLHSSHFVVEQNPEYLSKHRNNHPFSQSLSHMSQDIEFLVPTPIDRLLELPYLLVYKITKRP